MGPWWMTIRKLETDLQILTSDVDATASVPHLAQAPTVAHAQAAVAQAKGALRRVEPPDGKGGELLLRRASDAISKAGGVVDEARALRVMALRRRNGPLGG